MSWSTGWRICRRNTQADAEAVTDLQLPVAIDAQPEWWKPQVGRSVSDSSKRDSGHDAAIRLEMSSSSANRAARTSVYEFNTGGAALPCWVLESWLPAAANLGPAARFTGKREGHIAVAKHGRGTHRKADRCRFDSRHRICSPPGPHMLLGTITLDSLRMHDGRLESAHGAITCGSGTIDRRLVDAPYECALLCPHRAPTQPPELSNRHHSNRANSV